MGDHTETVDIEFDPQVTSYETLLNCFWKWHNPSSSHNRQYMSAIFYHNDEQKHLAEKTKAEHQKDMVRPIVTTITQALPFYDAENYHQKFILRQHAKVMNKLSLSDSELITSTTACRLNGYLSEYGTEEEFDKECADLHLPESVEAYVRQDLRKKQQK